MNDRDGENLVDNSHNNWSLTIWKGMRV